MHLQLTATLQGSGNIAHTHYNLPATLLLGVLLLGVLLLGVLLLGVLLLGVLLLRAIAHFHLILRYMCKDGDQDMGMRLDTYLMCIRCMYLEIENHLVLAVASQLGGV